MPSPPSQRCHNRQERRVRIRLSQVERHLCDPVNRALTDTRVVGIVGPRQGGKSTLARSLVAGRPEALYVSLDDRRIRTAAEADPHGFVADRPGLLAVDEVQRVPDLLLAIKSVVDLDARPGQFLVTGSSQLSANRRVSETLAGRIETLRVVAFQPGRTRRPRDFPRPAAGRHRPRACQLHDQARLPDGGEHWRLPGSDST